MDYDDGDSGVFLAVCLIYSILTNRGLNRNLLVSIGVSLPKDSPTYCDEIVEKILLVMEEGVRDGK